MCGRYVLKTLPNMIEEAMGPLLPFPDLPTTPRYNIAPTHEVPIIRLNRERRRELASARWGLIPFWTRDPATANAPINARCETAADRPTFRAALRQRRCLIPADGFYEWRREGKAKQPYYIHRRDDALLAFAGLWERWRDDAGHAIDSCTILTTAPNALMQPIHDRMPVLVDPADYAAWLDPHTPLDRAAAVLRPYPAEKLGAHPVSPQVNDPKHDGPGLIEPAPSSTLFSF
jgi:putative SOS response-associated peptidase YedK